MGWRWWLKWGMHETRPVADPSQNVASAVPSGGTRPAGITPLTEHERLMRHTGRPECPIPDHADALRSLGRVAIDRDAWKARALTAEARLRHPSNGQQAA